MSDAPEGISEEPHAVDSEAEAAAGQPMSAEDLGKAFARMLDGASQDTTSSDDTREEQSAEDGGETEDDTPPSPRQILESLLFVGTTDNEPLSTERLCQALQGVEPDELASLVEELNHLYASEARPYEVVTQGGGYRLVLRGEFERLRDKFYGKVRQARLSQAAVEVLAIVAYNQPVSADEVAELRRGTPSGPILSQLVRRQLLRIERTDTRPRKASYHTSDRFLDLFGLSNVSELPRPVESQESTTGG